MRCPKCHQTLDLETAACHAGHVFPVENDVLVLMDAAQRAHIDAIYRHREQVQNHLPPITDYDSLPHALADRHFEWRFRSQDADIVLPLLNAQRQSPPLTILEIGAWNGWLSHGLAQAGHHVTALDYTAHPTDGLGAKTHYTADWQTIQMDLTDLSLFDSDFDVVIINHGLHLFPDPVGYAAAARQLVEPGGLLILLNLTFFRDPLQRLTQLNTLKTTFQQSYGVPLLLHPARGYMDFADKTHLQEMGIVLHRYRQRWRATLKSLLICTAPSYFYGVARV